MSSAQHTGNPKRDPASISWRECTSWHFSKMQVQRVAPWLSRGTALGRSSTLCPSDTTPHQARSSSHTADSSFTTDLRSKWPMNPVCCVLHTLQTPCQEPGAPAPPAFFCLGLAGLGTSDLGSARVEQLQASPSHAQLLSRHRWPVLTAAEGTAGMGSARTAFSPVFLFSRTQDPLGADPASTVWGLEAGPCKRN